jgi:hypothetical protein
MNNYNYDLEEILFYRTTKAYALEQIKCGDYYLRSLNDSGISIAHDERNERAAEYLRLKKEENEFYDNYKNMEAEVLYKCIILATPLPYDVIGSIMEYVLRINSKQSPPDLDWWHELQGIRLSENLEERDEALAELEEDGQDTIENIIRLKHDWNDWHEKTVIPAVTNVWLH